MEIIHSHPSPWDTARQQEMKRFFSSVSDSIIALRKQRREEIADRMLKLQAHENGAALTNLKEDFKRFSGTEYNL